MGTDKQGSVDLIKQLIRATSAMRLKNHCGIQQIEFQEANPNSLVHGHWMALILVSAGAVRINFKVHYMTEDAKHLAASAFKKAATEVNSSQTADFLKEFCNLSAGAIKQTLEKNGLSAGISLPLVVRGFEEIFFPLADNKTVFIDVWKLAAPKGSVTCSTLVEVFDEKSIAFVSPADVAEANVDSGGEVDFL